MAHYHMLGGAMGVADKAVYAFSTLRDLEGGHHESRTRAEDCVGVGGIALFGWRLSRDGFFVARESVDVYR
jgi:hypothetical protein